MAQVPPVEISRLEAVVALAVQMRAAQKLYFTGGRTRDQLDASKKLERAFDKAAADLEKRELF